MKKKLLIAILFMLLGVGLSFYIESFLRNMVFNLYEATTNESLQLVGKRFFLFPETFYNICFGVTFAVFAVNQRPRSLKDILTNIGILLVVFILSTIIICAIAANLELMICTNCDEGIKRLSYTQVNYGLILGMSILISVVPSIMRLVKRAR